MSLVETKEKQRFGEQLLDFLGRKNLYETNSKLVGPDYLRSSTKRQLDRWGSRVLLLGAGPVIGVGAFVLAAVDHADPWVRVEGPNGLSRLKLQTMRPGAQREEEGILKTGRTLLDWSDEGDPRLTRAGRLIRKTSIDELPALIDVAAGKFYLVGPKMLTLTEYGYHVLPYANLEPYSTYLRFLEKEGIKYGFLGPYILSGRKSRSYVARVVEDVEYMEKASLRADYRLIMLNALAVFIYRGK